MMESVRIEPVALAEVLGTQAPDVFVTGLSIDSTQVNPGDVFVALPGRNHHGASFAEDALARGAVAIVTDEIGRTTVGNLPIPVIVVPSPRAHLGSWAARLYRTDQHRMRIVGVTGTNGKTTVAHLVAGGAAAMGLRVAVIGTLGIEFEGTRVPTGRTTPEAPVLHRWLAVMAASEIDLVVVEVSSHAMSEHRVDGVPFAVAAFTHLSHDHLDYHGTMEAYFAAKASLFTDAYARQAVVGIDDEWGRRLADQVQIPCTTWSCHRGDVTGTSLAGGVRIVDADDRTVDMALSLTGAFNVANATCAAAVLKRLGLSVWDHPDAFAQVTVPGRMETIMRADGARIIVDYAHTPDAIERVVNAVRGTGRIVVVIGAGGDRDHGKRRGMGVAAGAYADIVIVTDDNPRSEDPAAIRAEVIAGVQSTAAQVFEIADRRAAIERALAVAGAGDTVLVLGKGHEGGQEVGGVMTAFDDRVVVREAIVGSSP